MAHPTIPPILLEGDYPGELGKIGVHELEESNVKHPADPEKQTPATLPESYGTGELVLTARDPHWLYAHWDFSPKQQPHAAVASKEGRLMLRVFLNELQGEFRGEVPVKPETTHRFLHVGPSSGRFIAELGYYQPDGGWTRLSASGVVSTPPVGSEETTEPMFATIPPDLPMSRLVELAKEAAQESAGLAAGVEQLRREGHPGLPVHPGSVETSWTPEQEAALAEVLATDSLNRLWLDSQVITDLVQGRVSSEEIFSPSSPFGGWSGGDSFWFDINAELVLYGSTDPNATVTISGRKIKLRPDGSFTFRFSLPDGEHKLEVKAASLSGDDVRKAGLRFVRSTLIQGEVGEHPQDSALRPPRPENLGG